MCFILPLTMRKLVIFVYPLYLLVISFIRKGNQKYNVCNNNWSVPSRWISRFIQARQVMSDEAKPSRILSWWPWVGRDVRWFGIDQISPYWVSACSSRCLCKLVFLSLILTNKWTVDKSNNKFWTIYRL